MLIVDSSQTSFCFAFPAASLSLFALAWKILKYDRLLQNSCGIHPLITRSKLSFVYTSLSCSLSNGKKTTPVTFLSASVGFPSILSKPSKIERYKGFFLVVGSSAGRNALTGAFNWKKVNDFLLLCEINWKKRHLNIEKFLLPCKAQKSASPRHHGRRHLSFPGQGEETRMKITNNIITLQKIIAIFIQVKPERNLEIIPSSSKLLRSH